MNNQGWGLRIMLFFCACFIFILVMTASAINKTFRDIAPREEQIEPISYYNLEVKMVNAMKRYIKDNYNDVSDIKIDKSLNRLIKENYIDIVKDPYNKKECNGYVIFTKNGNNINYEPYLRCGDIYKTSGYEYKYEW